MKVRPAHKISISLPDIMIRWLRNEAKARMCSVSQIIRDSVNAYTRGLK